jgi:KTSC domain
VPIIVGRFEAINETNGNDMYATLISVESTAIRAVSYDGHTLTVEFHSGRIYHHPGVPYQVFEEFMRALSKGAFYNQHIRGRYR